MKNSSPCAGTVYLLCRDWFYPVDRTLFWILLLKRAELRKNMLVSLAVHGKRSSSWVENTQTYCLAHEQNWRCGKSSTAPIFHFVKHSMSISNHTGYLSIHITLYHALFHVPDTHTICHILHLQLSNLKHLWGSTGNHPTWPKVEVGQRLGVEVDR